MQADTAMPTQSAPQPSVTPQASYGAPVQTAAQQPAVATTPQWVAPQQAAVAPAPQVQAQMGAVAPQYNPTHTTLWTLDDAALEPRRRGFPNT